MTPLEATIVVVVDFVAVVVHIVVVVVVNVVVVVVNVGVVALFVVTDHRSINVNLRLLKAKVKFLWWVVGCRRAMYNYPTYIWNLFLEPGVLFTTLS